uniref:Uncharacterized protein n=1 Tax=Heterorhabditis bacteriophora TaxID=37862 RepID=A0A1I7X558_HETBA
MSFYIIYFHLKFYILHYLLYNDFRNGQDDNYILKLIFYLTK